VAGVTKNSTSTYMILFLVEENAGRGKLRERNQYIGAESWRSEEVACIGSDRSSS
jgi:hypothetical protein